MKKKIFAIIMALSMAVTVSCAPRPNTSYRNQQPNKGQTSGQNQQPIQGAESSVTKMGDIQRIKVTAGSTNVRSGCSGDASVLQTSNKNSTMDVVSQVSDWYAVKLSNNQIGFVPKHEATPVVVDNNRPQVSTDTTNTAPSATGNTTSSTAPKTPAAPTNASTLTTQEQEMLRLINQARAQNNAPPLQIDMQVTNVARIKAQDMIDNNYFSHNSPKYGSPFDMLKSFGISYVQAGENIAGNQTVQNAHNALMNSPGHRKNILNPDYTHIGLGIRSGGPYGNMFSQMFVSKPK